MPIKLIAPIVETFTLDESDKKYGNDGDPTTVTIRQATQAQHEERQSLFSTLEQRFSDENPDDISLIQNLSSAELMRKEVWLTLIDSNLQNEDGSIVFPSKKNSNGVSTLDLTKKQFDHAWGKLMPDIALEIHSKVLLVNPLWQGVLGKKS